MLSLNPPRNFNLRESPSRDCTTLGLWSARRNHTNLLKHTVTENRVDERETGTNLSDVDSITSQIVVNIICRDDTIGTTSCKSTEIRGKTTSSSLTLRVGVALKIETRSTLTICHKNNLFLRKFKIVRYPIFVRASPH